MFEQIGFFLKKPLAEVLNAVAGYVNVKKKNVRLLKWLPIHEHTELEI